MRKNNRNSNSKNLLRAPAYPLSGPDVFRGLRAALTQAFGFQPGFARLASIIGERPNLTYHWFAAMRHQHVIGFVNLLEHLPEPKRREFMNQYCRELPRLDNPRLANDAIAVSNLESLLRHKTGITWIQSGTEYHRTFVITALGHIFSQIWRGAETVAGIDVHEPRKWVPVDSVIYIKEPLPLETARKNIAEMWPAIRSSQARLILLNEVWGLMPELHQEILELGLKHHVVVTVPKAPEDLKAGSKASTHLITMSQPRPGDQWIRLKVEAM